jgi:acetyl esterase/lipase
MNLNEKERIPLWKGLPPGMKSDWLQKEVWDRGGEDNILRVSKVTQPELLFYPSERSDAMAPAVIICPGGGYHILAIEHEGSQVAEAFNKQGFHAFVLKYRLPDPSLDPGPCFWPLQDIQRSFELVRSEPERWGINPHRVGVMGFSAGGHLAACASTLYKHSQIGNTSVSLRPDFSILIYPVVSFTAAFQHSGSGKTILGSSWKDKELASFFSPDENITDDTPPAYLCHTVTDEAVPIENSRVYHDKLSERGIKVLFDEIESGKHGFGMLPDSPAAGWFDRLADWLVTI